MTSPRPRHDPRTPSPAVLAERQRLWQEAASEATPWAGGSSLVSGVLLFGGLGWLAQHASGWLWPLPVGILLGTAAALTSLWFRYGVDRSAAGVPQVNGSAAAPGPSRGGTTRPTPGPMEDAP